MPITAEGLYEAYYTTQDKKEKDVEVMAGQLNVATYPQQQITLCLVGVNEAHYSYSTTELTNQLNTIFAQAITKVNVSTANIEVEKFSGTLSAKESGALSAYNSDMKKLIKKVKKLPNYNCGTYYIMLVEQSDNASLAGFMPLNSQFGFIFSKANTTKEQLNRTIAHEVAHGAFRLWHTFSNENIYTAPQGTTNNLMDYNGTAAELYKYQWDYIHNPQQGIVRWMVEEEESESVLDNLVHYYLHLISDANANNKNELNLLVENGSIETNEKYRGEISYVKMNLDGGLEKLQPAKIDLLKQNIKKTTRPKTEYDVTIDPKERIVETDGTEFVKYSFHKVVKGEKTRDIAIQILVKKEEADWLDYFLYGEMKLKELEQITDLTPAEIKEKREYIKTLPEDVRADWYLELQKKVPYHSQRDNESPALPNDYTNNKWMKDNNITTAGDIMCNLTSEAMCLEMLGIEFPCKDCNSDCDKYKQFEDYLECLRSDSDYGDRKEQTTHSKLSQLFGVNCKYEPIQSNKQTEIESKLGAALKEGKSILLSTFGHQVRLQAITDKGLIVDDPYGKVYDFSKSGCTPKYYIQKKYDQRNGNNLGNNNLWEWSILQTNNIIINYAEIYSTND